MRFESLPENLENVPLHRCNVTSKTDKKRQLCQPHGQTKGTNRMDGNLGLYHHMQFTPVQQVWTLYVAWFPYSGALKTVSVPKRNV